MGQIYRENYKRWVRRGGAAANSPDDILRLEDGLASISGSIVGGGTVTVIADGNNQLLISASGGGGSQNLSQVLVEGNETLGSQIVVTSGDYIRFNDENDVEQIGVSVSGNNKLVVHDGIYGAATLEITGDIVLGNARIDNASSSTIQFLQKSGATAFTVLSNTFRDNNNDVQLGPNGMSLDNGSYIEWTQGAGATSSPRDIRVARDSAGLLEVTNPDTSNRGSIIANGMSRRLHVNTATSGNVGSGEQTLLSYTVGANTLDSDGAEIRVRAWGDFGTNSGARRVLAYVDGWEACRADVTDVNGNGRAWEINIHLVRVSSTSVEFMGSADVFSATNNTERTRQRQTFADLSANAFDIEIACENIADSANDEIEQHALIVSVIPAA